ncbi:hypothetical protein Lepto7375DRAFT_7349 [Leptolyngbya sp. PCC 7375]|nr:hypothetical protein Lepto7375DRAFT_7349 [Leptolyngbya sp. PCC 7375]
MSDIFYVVRASKLAFLGAKGSTEFLAEAKRFDSHEAASKAAPKDAHGVSEYKLINGRPQPQRHMGISAKSIPTD